MTVDYVTSLHPTYTDRRDRGDNGGARSVPLPVRRSSAVLGKTRLELESADIEDDRPSSGGLVSVLPAACSRATASSAGTAYRPSTRLATTQPVSRTNRQQREVDFIVRNSRNWVLAGSLAEWSACWTRAQNGPGSNRSRDAVG